MASKDMKISIAGDQVMYSNISRSKDGYNSARVVAKINEKEYMSISYEWEGESVPDFAMNLMGFMQANKIELANEKMCKKCKHPVSKCDCNDGAEPEPSTSDKRQNKAAKKKENPFKKKDEDMEDEEDPKNKKKMDDKKKDKKPAKKEKSKKMCAGCGKDKAGCDCEGGFKMEKESSK